MKTIKLREFLKTDFEGFKTQIDDYLDILYYSPTEIGKIDDSFLKFVYNILKSRYSDSYIRYCSPDAFLQDLAFKLNNFYPRYKAMLQFSIASYNLNYDNFILGNYESTRDIVEGENIKTEEGFTPATTTLDPTDQYDDSKSKTDRERNEQNKLKSQEYSNALKRLNDIQNLRTLMYNDVTGLLSQLFTKVWWIYDDVN